MENADKAPLVMTGCSGLLGTRLCKTFSDEYAIVGLDIVEPSDPTPLESFFKCDLTSDECVHQVLTAIRERYGDTIASVIHLAAYYDFSGEPSPLYEELTVQGTGRLLRDLKNFNVEQFIFSSTLLVMMPRDDEDAPPLTEESATQAEWSYPQSKLRTEALLRERHGDIPVVVLRIAGVYDEEGHSLPISQHIRRIYEKELDSLVFPGDKDHGQPFVHLDDVCACFRKAVEKRKALDDFETFLIAEPDVVSQGELQESIGEYVHGTRWPTIRIPKSVAKFGAWAKDKLTKEERFIKPWMIDLADDHYPVEITRARERLEWEPQFRLRDTLQEMVASLKRDPEAFYERHDLPKPSKKELLEPQREAS
jgi:nucleoside-diphosphate-sugar epimerase